MHCLYISLFLYGKSAVPLFVSSILYLLSSFFLFSIHNTTVLYPFPILLLSPYPVIPLNFLFLYSFFSLPFFLLSFTFFTSPMFLLFPYIHSLFPFFLISFFPLFSFSQLRPFPSPLFSCSFSPPSVSPSFLPFSRVIFLLVLVLILPPHPVKFVILD